jgi:hypothetical protein
MCKEMPVIPVNRVVDTKMIGKKLEGRGGGEAQGPLTPKKLKTFVRIGTRFVMVSVTTSRSTGEMEVASSDGLPQPEAGAWGSMLSSLFYVPTQEPILRL